MIAHHVDENGMNFWRVSFRGLWLGSSGFVVLVIFCDTSQNLAIEFTLTKARSTLQDADSKVTHADNQIQERKEN